jgi:hypothetical protein
MPLLDNPITGLIWPLVLVLGLGLSILALLAHIQPPFSNHLINARKMIGRGAPRRHGLRPRVR